MSIQTQLPDLAKSFQLLKFSVELPEKVMSGGVIEMAIKDGIAAGRVKQVVIMIKSMAEDNPRLMNEIIGTELLKEIVNY